jgi:DNA-binding beta-propeller fold protein YncE
MGSFFTAHAQETPTPIFRSKSLLTIKSNFSQPSDVAVGNNGNIYVLDGVNNRVKVFNQKGAPLFSFGGTGKGNGKLNFPLGIGIDAADLIYVADSGNHRVQIFTPEGRYLSQFSTDTNKKKIKPSDPTDVVVNSTLKRCYVVDNDNHWVFIHDLEKGKSLSTHGTMGMEKKEFRFPFLLDIDREGNLYIVEVINTRVKVLDPEGSYLATIGGWGVEKGEFYRPKGVAIDSKNRVFVSDSYLGIIQVFEKDGEFLSVLGDEKGNIMKFETPTGLFIDKNMRLYVVEMFVDRVRVLHLKD